jgi:hypothetical protein
VFARRDDDRGESNGQRRATTGGGYGPARFASDRYRTATHPFKPPHIAVPVFVLFYHGIGDDCALRSQIS